MHKGKVCIEKQKPGSRHRCDRLLMRVSSILISFTAYDTKDSYWIIMTWCVVVVKLMWFMKNRSTCHSINYMDKDLANCGCFLAQQPHLSYRVFGYRQESIYAFPYSIFCFRFEKSLFKRCSSVSSRSWKAFVNKASLPNPCDSISVNFAARHLTQKHWGRWLPLTDTMLSKNAFGTAIVCASVSSRWFTQSLVHRMRLTCWAMLFDVR